MVDAKTLFRHADTPQWSFTAQACDSFGLDLTNF